MAAVPYPNFPDKHAAAPLVTPQRSLDYARARGRLIDFEAPAGVLIVYRRSLMARLVAREIAAQRFEVSLQQVVARILEVEDAARDRNRWDAGRVTR